MLFLQIRSGTKDVAGSDIRWRQEIDLFAPNSPLHSISNLSSPQILLCPYISSPKTSHCLHTMHFAQHSKEPFLKRLEESPYPACLNETKSFAIRSKLRTISLKYSQQLRFLSRNFHVNSKLHHFLMPVVLRLGQIPPFQCIYCSSTTIKRMVWNPIADIMFVFMISLKILYLLLYFSNRYF